MQAKYDVMSYRQDLRSFGEPKEGSWDGFQRINTDAKTGGIIGVFRHGAIELKRIVTVNGLDPLKTYTINSMNGKTIVSLTGEQLRSKGFECALSELYDGELFEIGLK